MHDVNELIVGVTGLWRDGRKAEALAQGRQALADHPGNAAVQRFLAEVLLQAGEVAEAIDLARVAVRTEPTSASAQAILGLALARAARKTEAQLALGRSLALKPEAADVQTLLTQVGQSPLSPDQERLMRYQGDIEGMRRSPYMDYPAHVHLETLAVCTAACNFCPYPSLERKGTRMGDALIAKVIDDLTAVPQAVPFQLSPFKVNEPFADHRLFDLLAEFNARLPHASLTLTSNGSLLSEDKLRRLAQVQRLGYLWLSVNDHRPDDYEATMCLPYALVRERLDLIHRYKANGDLTMAVVLSRVGDGTQADRDFCQWVQTTYPLFEYSVFQRGAWIGQVTTAVPEVPNVGCARWFDLSITATGTVAHCCMDGQAEWPIGDVTTQSVLEIYNAPHYRALREKALTRLEAAPCHSCSFL